MFLNSYKLTREYSYSNPRKEMLREKTAQIRDLYKFAMDREDNVLLNGKPFSEAPRIFDRKFIDTVHHKIIVETILEEDWIECGDYLEYENMMWLCLNSYSFHKLYCRATFMSCDWKIYWIDQNGELKSQYVVDQNSTQYNSGETSNSTMTLGSAQHMLKMQCNEDTVLIDSPMRFAIDRNIKNPTCYKVTQNDNSAYNYGKGLCCITVTETPQNIDLDRLITLDDGKQVWVCDYVEPPTPLVSDETTVLTTIISGGTNLKNGYKRSYDVKFTDKSGNNVDWKNINFKWNIVDNLGIVTNSYENKIDLFLENEDFIGITFLLQVIIDNKIAAETKITIIE